MAENNQQNTEKYSLDDILMQLSPEQLLFLEKRLLTNSNTEAARLANLDINTVNHWPEFVRVDAIKLLRLDGVHLARELRRRALPEAMTVKVSGLRSRDERLRQNVATEIIEWEMGKATTPIDHKGGVSVNLDGFEWKKS